MQATATKAPFRPIGMSTATGQFEGPAKTRSQNGVLANQAGKEWWESQRFFYADGRVKRLRPKADEMNNPFNAWHEPPVGNPTFDYATANAIRRSIYDGMAPIDALLKHIDPSSLSPAWLRENGCDEKKIPTSDANMAVLRRQLLRELRDRGQRIDRVIAKEFELDEEDPVVDMPTGIYLGADAPVLRAPADEATEG